MSLTSPFPQRRLALKLRLLAPALVFVSQTVIAFAQQSEPAKGRIEGTVLRTGTNEPIAGMRVTLTRATQGQPGGLGGGIISLSTSTVGTPPPPTIPATAARGAAPAPVPQGPPPLPTIPSVTTDREGKFL